MGIFLNIVTKLLSQNSHAKFMKTTQRHARTTQSAPFMIRIDAILKQALSEREDMSSM